MISPPKKKTDDINKYNNRICVSLFYRKSHDLLLIKFIIKSIVMDNQNILTMENLNSRVIEVEYAVRGPILIRAAEIEKEIKSVEIFFLIKYSYLFILLLGKS
jgi:hypothetical protein